MTHPADGQEMLEAPRTPLEEAVAAAWGETLGIDRLDVNTNFFSLGGTSLQMARVNLLLREALAVEIPVRILLDQPTIAGLAREIERLRQGDTAPARSISPAWERTGETFRAPTSHAQRALWLIDQIQGPSAVYSIPAAVEVEGPLDLDALRRALAFLVERHEMLRTTFAAAGGVPEQIVHPRIDLPFTVVDLRDLAAEKREVAAVDHLVGAARELFDLTTGPLFRVDALRIEERWHVLFFNMHHVITDGRSVVVFIEELLSAYAGLSEGREPELPPLQVQYADFAAWQQETVDEEAFAEQIAYWKERLRGPLPTLRLPADRVRPGTPSGRGATESVHLPRTALRDVQRLGREHGATPFMTMLAVWYVLLHRYSGQADVVVGTPSANREQPELESMLGYFVNTLALRVDLSDDPSFADLLAQVRQVVAGAYAHQDVPFERVVDEVGADRSTQQPVFRAMLAFQEQPPPLSVADLEIAQLDLDTDTAKFDLTLLATDLGTSFRLSLEYSTDLFLPATAQRILGHLRNLLEAVAADPGKAISALPLLDPGEEARVTSWSQPARAASPTGACLHRMFEEQVERTPEGVAVDDGVTSLTYGELNRRANLLARELRRRGVRGEQAVGLCMNRCVELVVGILGILKAGAVYVPVDPTTPPDRLAFVARDTGMTLMLTSGELLDRLTPDGVALLAVDAGAQPGAGWSAGGDEGNPDFASDPRRLAYVIYTSGSTGTPKGVEVTHGQVAPVVSWGLDRVSLQPDDRVLQHLAFFFDWSVYEIFVTLCSGARLVVPVEAWLDPGETVKFLTEQRVTVLHATPTQMQALLAVGVGQPTVRMLCLGAERLTVELAERSRDAVAPGAVLWNMYGPTECAIIAASGVVAESEETGMQLSSVPIGQPVAGSSCWVLDPSGNLQPVGVTGELWIGGEGVARGYRDRPGLTADRFRPDPRRSGGRMYRTGDLVRWLPDGRIEFLGRSDDQITVRGVRVEPGEIEAALEQHPAVSAAVVLLDETASGEQRLVAYAVPDGGAEIDEDGLRRFLGARLPLYMLPTDLVRLAALPYTPSGKIDRGALPRPNYDGGAPAPGRAPSTPSEEAVAAAWADALGTEPPDVDTNFFTLGGTSLQVVSMMLRLRETFGIEIPLRALFDAPTIAELAAHIELLQWTVESQRTSVDVSGDREEGEL